MRQYANDNYATCRVYIIYSKYANVLISIFFWFLRWNCSIRRFYRIITLSSASITCWIRSYTFESLTTDPSSFCGFRPLLPFRRIRHQSEIHPPLWKKKRRTPSGGLGVHHQWPLWNTAGSILISNPPSRSTTPARVARTTATWWTDAITTTITNHLLIRKQCQCCCIRLLAI